MSELFEYGFATKEDVRGITPTSSPPPLCTFSTGLDLLYDKIMNVLMQRSHGIFYDRDFKSELEHIPFEPDSKYSVERIQNIIYTALTNNIDNITIDTINVESQEYDFGIVYNIEIRISYEQKTHILNLKLDRYGLTVGS